MRRAFAIDVLACPHCGGRLREQFPGRLVSVPRSRVWQAYRNVDGEHDGSGSPDATNATAMAKTSTRSPPPCRGRRTQTQPP